VIEGKAMRKDDILEGDSEAPVDSESATPSEHPKIDLEDGKPDADLFGAATLAKLSAAAIEDDDGGLEADVDEEVK
jgi:DNA-binding transcriptional MocR family regulator